MGIELLADPTRRTLVALIAVGIRRPSRLAQEIGLSRQATSRQLRILARAGLIRPRRSLADGRQVLYFIDLEPLGQITAWLAGTEVGRTFAKERLWPPPQYVPGRKDADRRDDAA